MRVALGWIIAPLDLQKDERKFHDLRQKNHNPNPAKPTIGHATDNVATPTVKAVARVVDKVLSAAVGHNRSRP